MIMKTNCTSSRKVDFTLTINFIIAISHKFKHKFNLTIGIKTTIEFKVNLD